LEVRIFAMIFRKTRLSIRLSVIFVPKTLVRTTYEQRTVKLDMLVPDRRYGIKSTRVLTCRNGEEGFFHAIVVVLKKGIQHVWIYGVDDVDKLVSDQQLNIIDERDRFVLPGFMEVGCQTTTSPDIDWQCISCLYAMEGITTVVNCPDEQFPLPMALSALNKMTASLRSTKLAINMGQLFRVSLADLYNLENPENVIKQFIQAGSLGFSLNAKIAHQDEGNKSPKRENLLDALVTHNARLVLEDHKFCRNLNLRDKESHVVNMLNKMGINDHLEQWRARSDSDSSSSKGSCKIDSAGILSTPTETIKPRRYIKSCESARSSSSRIGGRVRSASLSLKEWRLDLDETCMEKDVTSCGNNQQRPKSFSTDETYSCTIDTKTNNRKKGERSAFSAFSKLGTNSNLEASRRIGNRERKREFVCVESPPMEYYSRTAPVKSVRQPADVKSNLLSALTMMEGIPNPPPTLMVVLDETKTITNPAIHILKRNSTVAENPVSRAWNFARSTKTPFDQVVSDNLRILSSFLGISEQKGRICEGMDADICIFEASYDQPVSTVTSTYCNGMRVFHRRANDGIAFESKPGTFLEHK